MALSSMTSRCCRVHAPLLSMRTLLQPAGMRKLLQASKAHAPCMLRARSERRIATKARAAARAGRKVCRCRASQYGHRQCRPRTPSQHHAPMANGRTTLRGSRPCRGRRRVCLAAHPGRQDVHHRGRGGLRTRLRLGSNSAWRPCDGCACWWIAPLRTAAYNVCLSRRLSTCCKQYVPCAPLEVGRHCDMRQGML